jgi:hypothetical protein
MAPEGSQAFWGLFMRQPNFFNISADKESRTPHICEAVYSLQKSDLFHGL